jgi:hypothetical protein
MPGGIASRRYSDGFGELSVSFRHKMHIGYFYSAGSESARVRLAVFRSISFEEARYSVSSAHQAALSIA